MFNKIFYYYYCSYGAACCGSTICHKFWLKRNGKQLLTIPQINDDVMGFGVVASIDIFIEFSLIIRIK